MGRDPTRRFADRVEHYVKYRPSYPAELIPLLVAGVGLEPTHVVADIGSGTGKLSELFLDHGNRVIGVEPNVEMRAAGDALLAGRAGFSSTGGRAEATALEDDVVDIVVAGQAFHWFDVAATRVELARVLRLPRRVALVWNNRRIAGTAFMTAYEALLMEFGTDYDRVDHQRMDPAAIDRLFGGPFRQETLRYRQVVDLAGLHGRLLSSSYVPGPGELNHEAILAAATRLFTAHEQSGQVHFEYDTLVYQGCLKVKGDIPV